MSVDKRIQAGRKIATAHRNMGKIKVIRKENGTVKLNTGVIVQNLPEKEAKEVEGMMSTWIDLLTAYLKGATQDNLENVYADPSTIPEGMSINDELEAAASDTDAGEEN